VLSLGWDLHKITHLKRYTATGTKKSDAPSGLPKSTSETVKTAENAIAKNATAVMTVGTFDAGPIGFAATRSHTNKCIFAFIGKS